MKLPGVTIKDETKVKDENRKKIVDLMWKNLDVPPSISYAVLTLEPRLPGEKP